MTTVGLPVLSLVYWPLVPFGCTPRSVLTTTSSNFERRQLHEQQSTLRLACGAVDISSSSSASAPTILSVYPCACARLKMLGALEHSRARSSSQASLRALHARESRSKEQETFSEGCPADITYPLQPKLGKDGCAVLAGGCRKKHRLHRIAPGPSFACSAAVVGPTSTCASLAFKPRHNCAVPSIIAAERFA